MLSRSKVPAPGSENGPCEKSCGHIKCNELRHIANTICSICHKPIGYEIPFLQYEERYFHEKC